MTARILVVDDEPTHLRLLTDMLTREYYQVASATNADAAFEIASVWYPDLILLSVMKSGTDGYEICRQLKASQATQRISVVMVGMFDQAQDTVKGLESGADDFLIKPLDDELLLARVRSLVRLKHLQDEWHMRYETALSLGIERSDAHGASGVAQNILVIEDQPQNARDVFNALDEDGISITHVSTTETALFLLRQQEFKLIVLSLALRDEDALRFASHLRSEPQTRDIPMLLLVDSLQKKLLLRGFDLGANDYVFHPLDKRELRARVHNQLRRYFMQSQMQVGLGRALEQALVDPLTGLYNRRYLMRHLASQLEDTDMVRFTGPGVLMIDLDNFKDVNDRWGHAAGDSVLLAIASVLRTQVRIVDTVARLGGEEFVVLMPNTILEEALGVAERLRLAVEDMLCVVEPGVVHKQTVSIGVAVHVRGDVDTPEGILKRADAALYRAKQAGKNRVLWDEAGA